MIFQNSDEFDSGLRAAMRLNNRAEVAVNSTKWIIERRPDHYPRVAGTRIRCATFRPLVGLPELRLFYRVESEPDGGFTCYLLALRFDLQVTDGGP